MRKNGFSLIEVLFVAGFLAMIGVAIIALSAAALRLITSAEIHTVAHGLAQDAVSYVETVALPKTQTNFFSTYFPTCSASGGFYNCNAYVTCPAEEGSLGSACAISSSSDDVQVGRNRTRYTTAVSVISTDAGGSQVNVRVMATTSWSKRTADKVIVGKIFTLEKP